MCKSLLLATVAIASISATTIVCAQDAPIDPTGYTDATAAYQAFGAGDAAQAVVAAERAVAADPANLEWRLLLVDALLASDQPAKALVAVQPVADMWDHRVQTRRADAAHRTGDLAQAAEAYGLAAPLAPTPDQRAYLARSQVQVLVQSGRRDEARTALRAAHQSGILPGEASLDFAYAAVAAGDDQLAVQGFTTADEQAALTGAQALDAAYAARRAGQDRAAIRWLEQGARTLPPEQLTAQRRHEIGRELQALEDRFGGSATVSTGPAVNSATLPATEGNDVTQVGGEVWARLGGDNNGRPVQAFARVYQTVDADTGPVGDDSTQGWVGVRWKPFTATNLVLEASRLVAIGEDARDDTMLRASWSADLGGDIRFDRDSWPAAQVYVDAGRLLESEQNFAIVDASIGWTWIASTSRRDLVTAGIGVRADYDSRRDDETAVGIGPRLAWRHWVSDDDLTASDRYFDVSVGYYTPLGDNSRSEGLVAAVSFHF